MIVAWLFLGVPWVCLQFVIVVLPDHTHFLIRPIVLRELRIEIAPIIQLILKKYLATGKLPSDWTEVNVSPIFKKGEKSDLSNYRPIPFPCKYKVMRHIIASNLIAHLNCHCHRAKTFYLPQLGIEPRSLDLQANPLLRRCKSLVECFPDDPVTWVRFPTGTG